MNGRKLSIRNTPTILLPPDFEPPRHVSPEVHEPEIEAHAEPLLWTVVGGLALFVLVAAGCVVAGIFSR